MAIVQFVKEKNQGLFLIKLFKQNVWVAFSRFWVRKDQMYQKMARNVFKSPGRALEIGANVGSAFASRSPKTALSSLPEVYNFQHTGNRLYLEVFL